METSTPRWSKHFLKPMPPTPATKKKHIKTNATATHHEERNVLKPILPVTTPPHLKIKKKKN